MLKLLVACSLNDGKVKNEFIKNLKGIMEHNQINKETKDVNDI